jgi:hypothetical protein
VTYSLEGLRSGQVIEIGAELMYVWSVDSGTKSAVVERGFNGSTAAAHNSGDIVIVNPRFPRSQMLEAVNDELSDLSSPLNGLFQIKTLDIDYNGSDVMIDLDGVASIIDLLTVSVRYMTDDYPVARKVRLIRDVPTDDFPSGYALRFDQGVFPGRLRIVYKAAYVPVTAETTDLGTTCGVQDSVLDIVTLGTQIRLMAPREIKRNFTESQGDTRRGEEVTSGAIGNSIQNLQRLRRDRIQAEAARLIRGYPTFLSKD